MSAHAREATPTAGDERRQHPRLPLRAYAELQYANQRWDAHILDISATGARLALLSEHLLRTGDNLHVEILLDEDQQPPHQQPPQRLHLQGQLVHIREHILGYQFNPATEADAARLQQLLSELAQP